MADTRKSAFLGAVAAPSTPATKAALARARALAHHREGLHQYLSIRLGSREAGKAAFNSLRQKLDALTPDQLAREPGPRAHLYRLAREVLAEARSKRNEPSAEVDWYEPLADDEGGAYSEALRRLREALSPDDRELLELRYARELTPQELGHVLSRPVDEVIAQLEVAAERARFWAGRASSGVSGGLRVALQQALALPPLLKTHRLAHPSRPVGLAAGTVIGDRYELERRVGDGAFGFVYRALDRDVPGHVVALKLLHEPARTAEARRAALRELRLIASVFHPSVVDFKDHGWHQERLWFVMPWYEGETLEKRMLRAPLTRQEALEIFVPLAQALSTIHHAGIRHQDIKPENIFLAEVGEEGARRVLPVLIDLGVAAQELEAVVAGTPLYFAPEVAAQYARKPTNKTVSAKADVFSLALSLRNALEPDTRESVADTAEKAFIAYRADNVPAPPRSKDLRYLAPSFDRWMAHDPDKRPTAATLARELSVLAQPEQQRAQRRAFVRWAVPLSLAAAAAVATGASVYTQARRDAELARLEALEAQAELSTQSSEALKLQSGHAALERSHQTSLAALDELSDRVSRQQKRRRRLQDALRDARGETQRLLSELQQTRAEMLSLKSRLEASGEASERRHVEELTRELDSARAEAEVLERSMIEVGEAIEFEETSPVPMSTLLGQRMQGPKSRTLGDPVTERHAHTVSVNERKTLRERETEQNTASTSAISALKEPSH